MIRMWGEWEVSGIKWASQGVHIEKVRLMQRLERREGTSPLSGESVLSRGKF